MDTTPFSTKNGSDPFYPFTPLPLIAQAIACRAGSYRNTLSHLGASILREVGVLEKGREISALQESPLLRDPHSVGACPAGEKGETVEKIAGRAPQTTNYGHASRVHSYWPQGLLR